MEDVNYQRGWVDVDNIADEIEERTDFDEKIDAATQKAAAMAELARARADDIPAFAGFRDAADLTTLLANSTWRYDATGAAQVVAGDVFRTRKEGFSYKVLVVGSTAYDVATAGGLLLELQLGPDGAYNFAGTAPAADGVTDDFPKLRKLLDKPGAGTGRHQSSPPIYFPDARYFMSQTIELKRVTSLLGNSSGQPKDSTATLVFPANTAGIVVNRHDTLSGQIVAATTAADATLIDGINLESSGTTNLAAHGVWLRGRANVRNVRISGFAGAGFRPYAASNGGPESMGNCNCWSLINATIGGCEWGIYVEGYDANAGHASNVDCSSNRRWGIWDASFLGNTFTACHAASNGVGSGQSAYASYAGDYYHAVPAATEQQLVETQPGTNASIWRKCSPTHQVIPWTGGQSIGVYRHGGGYYSSNANARATFTGCYNEGGQGLVWMSQHSIFIGGFVMETPVVTGAHFEGRFGATWSRAPFRVDAVRLSDNRTITASLGGDTNSLTVFEWGDSLNNQAYRFSAMETGGYQYTRNGASIGIALRGHAETQLSDTWQLSKLGLGQGGTLRAFGRVTWSTAGGVVLPTSGTYVKGDIGLAPNPDAGGKIGWVCTTGGTAGSTAVFKSFGAIDA